MVKSVQIGIMNTQGTSEPMENKCVTNKTRQVEAKFPGALKILTGLCIGQMVMIATTAGTLGVFVNENMKQIEELRQRSEESQYTKDESYLKSSVQDLEARMIDFDKYGERIAELENDIHSVRNTSEKLIELESMKVPDSDVIKEHSEIITNISEHLSQMGSDPTISYRLSDLEINRMSDLSLIQSLNDTVTILAKQVAEGGTNGTTNTVQNISEILSELQLETMTCASVIQDQNSTLSYQSKRIAELASIRFEVQNNTDRINEIIFNRKSDNTLVQRYNDTLTDIVNRVTSLEPDKAITKDNYSEAITELIMNEKERNVTFTEHEKRISELETGLSLVLNTTDMITTLHNRSFNVLGDRFAALEPYCSMAINNSARLDEFQLDRQAGNYLIQEHNSTLQSVQSRLTTVEDYVKMPSYSFYAHNTIHTKFPYVGDIIIFSTIQLDESGVYSNTTGKYTAQTDGIYIFHATLCLEAGKEVDVNFVGGKSVIGFLRPGDFNFLECSTGTATARLQKGDEVYLEVANGDKSSVIEYDIFRNSFSGYLISV